MRVPTGEFVHLRHGLSVVAVVPSAQYLVHVGGVAQPAGFHHMMTDGTGNEVVTVGIGAWNEKFRHTPPYGCPLDMLSQRPPTEIIDFAEILIGTVEKRDVSFHPLSSILVGNVWLWSFAGFGIESIECLFVSGKTVGVGFYRYVREHGGSSGTTTTYRTYRRIATMEGEYAVGHWSAHHIGDMITGCRVEFIGTRHIEILIGGRLVVGFREYFSRAEDNARDGFHRRIKLPFAHFLAIHEIDGAVLTRGKQGLDVVFHTHLIFFHKGAIAGAALHSNGSCGINHDAGAYVAAVVHELDVEFSVVILVHHQVELHFQFLCGRNHTFGLGIVVGVAVVKIQPSVLQEDMAQARHIEVPVGHVGQCLVLRKTAVGMTGGV